MIWTARPRSEGAGALHYFAEGRGPLLILIHGVGLRAEAWAAMVPLLVHEHRVVCVDMPGHGQSPLDDTRELADYVSRFTAFVRAQKEPVRLIGHSMGAHIAVELAAVIGDAVKGVVALNTVYCRSPGAAKAVRARAQNLSSDLPPDPTPTLERWFGTRPTGADAAAATDCRHWLTKADAEGYATAYREFANTDGPSDATLGALACPAHFVTGENDPNSTPEMSRALASVCHSGSASVVPGAAHMMPMTHATAVTEQITDFFSTAGLSPEADQR